MATFSIISEANRVEHVSGELCWCRPIRKVYGTDVFIFHRQEETLNPTPVVPKAEGQI